MTLVTDGSSSMPSLLAALPFLPIRPSHPGTTASRRDTIYGKRTAPHAHRSRSLKRIGGCSLRQPVIPRARTGRAPVRFPTDLARKRNRVPKLHVPKNVPNFMKKHDVAVATQPDEANYEHGSY